MPDIDLDDMADLVSEDEGIEVPEEQPVEEPEEPEEQDVEAKEIDKTSGHKNPLGLDLLDCHLPESMVEGGGLVGAYIDRCLTILGLHPNTRQKPIPSKNETALYDKYKTLCMRRGVRPVNIRNFSLAVRFIAYGIDPVQRTVKDIDSLAL